MKRENYENNRWYPLTNNECWVEDLPEEFPNCMTLIYNKNARFGDYVRSYNSSSLTWEEKDMAASSFTGSHRCPGASNSESQETGLHRLFLLLSFVCVESNR